MIAEPQPSATRVRQQLLHGTNVIPRKGFFGSAFDVGMTGIGGPGAPHIFDWNEDAMQASCFLKGS